MLLLTLAPKIFLIKKLVSKNKDLFDKNFVIRFEDIVWFNSYSFTALSILLEDTLFQKRF